MLFGASVLVSILHCTLLYVATLHCTSPYLALSRALILQFTSLYLIILHCAFLYSTALHCTLLYFALFYCSLLHLAYFTSGTQPRGPSPSTGWRVTEAQTQPTSAHLRATSTRTWHICRSGIAPFKARTRSSLDLLASALDASETLKSRPLSVVFRLALKL